MQDKRGRSTTPKSDAPCANTTGSRQSESPEVRRVQTGRKPGVETARTVVCVGRGACRVPGPSGSRSVLAMPCAAQIGSGMYLRTRVAFSRKSL